MFLYPIGRPQFDSVNTFLVADLLLKLQPPFEEKLGLLRLHLPGKDALEQCPDLLMITLLDLEIEQNIKKVNSLGKTADQPLENGATDVRVDLAVI